MKKIIIYLPILLTIVLPELGFTQYGDFQSKMTGLTQKLLTVFLPAGSILGLIWCAVLGLSGNPEAKQKMGVVLACCVFGLFAPAVIRLISSGMNQMLNTSTVYKNLETKFTMFGLEIMDLISILTFSAVMNLFFGRIEYGGFIVLITSILLGGVFLFIKRGKQEKYLVHLAQFSLLPGCFYAGEIYKNDKKGGNIDGSKSAP